MKDQERQLYINVANHNVTPHRFQTPIVRQILKPLTEMSSLPDNAFLRERESQVHFSDPVDDLPDICA